MTLTVLSTTHLRAIAGYSYERGERYWRQGRVKSYEVEGKTISGVVQGTHVYAVRLFEHGRTVQADCTCPMGGVSEMCKHAVALALHHLAAGSGPVRPAHRVSSAFASDADLDSWVDEHHVRHELGVSAGVIAADVEAPPHVARSLQYFLQRWSLRDLATLQGASRAAYQGVGIEVAEAARRYLERAAKDVATAEREEREVRKPSEATVHPLWERLIELRGRLREHAAPRSRAFRATGKLELAQADHVLWWREPTRIVRPSFGVDDVSTKLSLVPATGFECRCGKPACVHGLSLVDAVLDVVTDPSQIAVARPLAECLLRPTWERALLELAEGERAKPSATIELWWMIGESYGEPTLAPLVRKQRKKGGMTAGARTSARRLLDDHGWALGEQDVAVAEHLATAADMLESRPVRAFRALVGHPRVARASDPERRIEVIRAPLGFVANPRGRGDRIELVPTAGTLVLDPERLEELLGDRHAGDTVVTVDESRCVVIEIAREARRTWNVLRRHGREFPAESHARLLDHLAGLARTVPIDVPESLLGARIVEEVRVVLRLRLEPDGVLEIDPLVRVAAGAPPFPAGVGPRDVLFARAGARVHARRELAAEPELVRAALAQLPIGDAGRGPDGRFHIDDPDVALAVVAAVAGPVPGVEAEWIDDRRPIVKSVGAAQLGVKITRKRDWFGIEGDLDIDGERVELAVLLDAVRHQRRFVRLDDQRWIELSELLKRRLAAIADQTYAVRDDLELSPGAIVAIRELAAEGANVETPPAWQLLTERLAAAEKLRPRPPSALVAELRPYQVEGHAWLSKVAAWGAGACLADDMGLGKTVQAIAVLLDRARTGPALVLAPTSVTLNWVDELRRFAPSLRPIVYADNRGCLLELGKKDVVIASYGLLVRDVEQLAKVQFATLVADEAQALKNAATRRAKAARALQAEFRIAMSGTPFENRLAELWSLFAVVFPGLLGSWEQFRERFATPIERDNDRDARAALSRVIRPFLLRRTKHEVARELPARTEIDVPVALSAEETELYEDARLSTLAKLGRVTAGNAERQRIEVLAALTKLRLLASHPRLYDAESAVASSKLQRLLELLEELRSEGHRALVFSQFTKHLALVQTELDRLGYKSLYLDGSTPAPERAALIRRFQSGEGEVFLLSLKAGGTGINLTAADYVIHLDPWWNPAVEDQATDRAHRIGQTKPVTVYRLIARGTVEEQILSLHADKRALVADVLDGTDAAARLTTKDLLALLR